MRELKIAVFIALVLVTGFCVGWDIVTDIANIAKHRIKPVPLPVKIVATCVYGAGTLLLTVYGFRELFR